MNRDEYIDEVMQSFNFDKVHRAMECVDWKWHDKVVPTIEQLKETARDLLKRAWEGRGTARTGGFAASLVDAGEECGKLQLQFIFERAWADLPESVGLPMCSVKVCANESDPRWFVYANGNGYPACDRHGGLVVDASRLRDGVAVLP